MAVAGAARIKERPGKSTGQERVHALLRADILGGRLHPDQRLRFAELSENYGASVGVVREAVSRLAAQGLVVAEAQQGARVVAISRDDLVQLTQARVCVETFALRLAIAEGDVGWESELLAAHHSMDRTPMLAPREPPHMNEAWSAAHTAFHEKLLAGTSNRRLRDIASNLRDAAEVYRRWSISEVDGPVRDVAAEHRAILDATPARDADLATTLLARHFELTAQVLLNSEAEGNSPPG